MFNEPKKLSKIRKLAKNKFFQWFIFILIFGLIFGLTVMSIIKESM